MACDPDCGVGGEFPDILVGALGDTLEPGARSEELLQHLRKMVVERSFGPVAVIRKDE